MYSKKVIIHYSAGIVEQPIIYQLVKKYDLIFNILKARIFPRREGVIVLELSGEKENFDQGVHFLREMGLRVEPLSKSVSHNTEKCVHCGACTSFCPTSALSMDPQTMKVSFDPEVCNGCGLCVTACPARAMEINLGF
ncbi:4Fe-4S dicluster domain-containing protein [Syntrophus gentianae]|uniref:4Fe-4S dicluster domain-containing protein n=1 Tax=Syntrophus gentianae TaxID=43775 RepID=A0A1H7YBC9_9BACT|nr:4Fe-4S binding protein [Syntrophus gentianae]SEM43201.1 4Fe-4S dicluster domain-containing protein [Syntrophus gentianae]